ncbi:hypothetical protein NL676_021465 [Syzygium grande]|nr:hypothetical protein NL676_021465 [Syzygium grande]
MCFHTVEKSIHYIDEHATRVERTAKNFVFAAAGVVARLLDKASLTSCSFVLRDLIVIHPNSLIPPFLRGIGLGGAPEVDRVETLVQNYDPAILEWDQIRGGASVTGRRGWELHHMESGEGGKERRRKSAERRQ